MRFAAVRFRPARVLRPLIGVLLAYAVAAQGLLIALGGFPLPAQANNGGAGFELCIHDSGGSTEQPAKAPGGSACTHCVFCFAGSHHAVIEAPHFVFHAAYVDVADATGPADRPLLPGIPAYSIASPRGPPLAA
jgi:hypothetical protein